MALNRDQLAQRVAKRTGYRKDFVRDVIDAFVDVMIEEISNTGDFKLRNVFSITSTEVKAYKGRFGWVDQHKRLSVKLSTTTKRLFQFVQTTGAKIDASNWRFVLDHIDEMDKAKAAERESQKKYVEETPELDSFAADLLRDDED